MSTELLPQISSESDDLGSIVDSLIDQKRKELARIRDLQKILNDTHVELLDCIKETMDTNTELRNLGITDFTPYMDESQIAE